jgi:hypothetical protein
VAATVTWTVVLVALGVALAIEQGWFALRIAAHAAGVLTLLGLAGEARGTGERTVVLIAAALVACSLFRVPSVGDATSVWQQLEIQLAIAATPWAFGVLDLSVLESRSDTLSGSLAIVVAVVALLAALGIRRWIHPAHFVSLLIGASVTLSIGFAILMSAGVAFVALAVQGAGLVVLSRTLGGNVRVLVNAALVTGIATIFVVGRMIDAWADDAATGDDVAHLLIIVAVAVAAWQTMEHVVWQVGALTTLVLTMIWLGSVLVHLPQGQAAVSISWAIVGTGVLVAGAVRKMPEAGATGLAVLGVTVGKLLTVDLQQVDTLWRAGLFFLVGIGLMRLGFMLPRLTRSGDGEKMAPRRPGTSGPAEPTPRTEASRSG